MKEKVSVFLDESGKDKNQISLIGSLLIPNNIYFSEEINQLDRRLKENKVKFHLADYRKHHYNAYVQLFDSMLSKTEYIRLNIVSFKRSRFSNHALSGKINDMVYAKIPERTIYGSLRGYSSFTEVEADIYIEYSKEYEQRALDKLIKNQLNTHSLYRYDKFKVNKANLYMKNTHIGIEFTDVSLGVVRHILENTDCYNRDTKQIRKSLAYKKRLVYTLIKKHDSFFSSLKLFELDDKGKLDAIDMRKYLDLFIAKYHRELECYPELQNIMGIKQKKQARKKAYRY